MDFRLLGHFRHLAHSLHFGQTAAAMHVSPSTLSRSIQRLEEECGTSLFTRNNKEVTLTSAGITLLDFADEVLAKWQQTKLDISESQAVLQGDISLFCSVTASFSHVPKLLESFRRHHPQIELKLITGDPAQAVDMVLDESTDLAVAIQTPDFPPELRFSLVDFVPLVLICPKESRLTDLNQVDWRHQQMILPEQGPTKRIVHHWLSEKGIRPRVYATVGGNEAMVSMVALGCGMAIVPRVVVDYSAAADKVNIIDIDDIEPYRLGLCCLSARAEEPLLQEFMTHSAN